MVDAVVSFAVQRLGDYLIQEANLLRGVKGEVESIQKELEWMQCFVKDAEAKQARNGMIRQWVSDIRDIAYDAEDVLDKYMLSVHDDKYRTSETEENPILDEEGTSKRRQGFFASIKKCSCIFSEESIRKEPNLFRKGKEKVTLHNIGKEIEALKRRLSDVSRRSESYGLQNIISDKREIEKSELERLKQLRRAPSFTVEEYPVGFEDDNDILLAKLFDKEPRRLMISICGMGGLGKTTLAKNIYHKSEVKNKFDCSAWVPVSQDYKTQDLLLRIIKSFNVISEAEQEDLVNKSEEDLERLLFKSLQGKSYLMVLDDIWRKEDWESLKRSFPDNKNGSRVIITTRNRQVAERSDEKTYVHELRFLREDESWDLFCEKAFHSTTREKEPEKLGREMVKKCNGLPLAIVVLGGLLSAKKPQEWRGVRDHIWRHLRNDSMHISYLLDLSFNDLSHQLKLCFLYLSIFPEDFEINVEKLIRLLVAEGFIPKDEDRTMEEVAKDNLDQLINRSLIQIEKRRWGRVSTCRVHDLLRDLAIQKAKELNFVNICDVLNDPTCSSVISSCRRQVIYNVRQISFWLDHINPLSRSLLFLTQDTSMFGESDNAPLFERLLLLRVLDNYKFVSRLPAKIGKLIHLKYLGLRFSGGAKLPTSILNLQRLQTLALSERWMELPIEINRMQELRHLIGRFRGTLPIENLTNLQTLKRVHFESWNKVNPAKLVNLRELRIEEEDVVEKFRGEVVFSLESIAKLKNLQLLSVELVLVNSFASLRPLSHCQRLVILRLRGTIEKLPEDMQVFLPNLECLSLTVQQIEEDPMPALEMLPNLTMLYLHMERQSLQKLSCRADGFPLLEILQLYARGLVAWQVEERAMPMLRSLKVGGILELKIPERLRSIPAPAEWEFEDLMSDFW